MAGRPSATAVCSVPKRLGLQFCEFLFKYLLDYYKKQNMNDSDGSRRCGSTEHNGAILHMAVHVSSVTSDYRFVFTKNVLNVTPDF